jgi:hypothetical protein
MENNSNNAGNTIAKKLVGLKGMGRKSNVAMVAIGGLAAVQQSKIAVIAVVIIALVGIISQAILEFYDKDPE